MFEDKMGTNQHLLSDDPRIHEGIHNWWERVYGFYGETGGGVDMEVLDNLLLLTEESADYIYSDFTPLVSKYEPGSRPLLERTAKEAVGDQTDEMDKMLAVMRRCRDNRDYGLPGVSFYGGSEEELLKRGAMMCNEIHRVFVCLCQIVGIPARMMGVHVSGHMMSEVYVRGKWMWVDCMSGNYAFNDDGTPASSWDIRKDPDILNRQTTKLWEDCRGHWPIARPELEPERKAWSQGFARDCFFHKNEITGIINYYVWEKSRYSFPWIKSHADPVRNHRAVCAENRYRKKHGWPDYYWCHYLYEGKLRTRD